MIARVGEAYVTRIFLSYRQKEGWGRQLREALTKGFPHLQIFRDQDDIGPGEEWNKVLEHELATCDAMIALISPNWLDVDRSAAQSLKKNHKVVMHSEIAEALRRGIKVFPVLVGGARLPAPDELPEDLKPLLMRQKFELTERHWEHDIQYLGQALDQAHKLSAGATSDRHATARAEESERAGGRPSLSVPEREERQPSVQATQRLSQPKVGAKSPQDVRTTAKSNRLPFTIAFILVILWLLGMLSSVTFGGLIHILLVIAVIAVLFGMNSSRRI